MNALVVIHYPVFGGPHNRVLRLHDAVAARGWRMIVLLPDQPGNAAARLGAGGVPVVRVPLGRLRASRDPRIHARFAWRFVGDVARIRRQIVATDADLVVVAGLANPHAALAARWQRVPVVWQIIDSRTPHPLRVGLMPIVNRCADALMFGGQALADLHLDQRPPRAPSFICPPPVDLDRFVASTDRRARTRRRLGMPDDAVVVGTVAHINPAKGIEYFVRAAARIYRSHPDTWFMVVGARYETHRRYSAQVDAEVARSGIPSNQFLFVGEREDVEHYYAAMDVKLITSVPRSEGTTTTAMEAMACEVPVVAFDVGAVAEVVEDRTTGFVVPPLDLPALVQRTNTLIENPELRRTLAARGRSRVQRFSIERSADGLVEAFETAIRRGVGSRRSQEVLLSEP